MTQEPDTEIAIDHAAMDATERRFWREICESVAPDVATERGIEVATFGPIQASLVANLADVPMLNLVLGAGQPGVVDQEHLGAAIEWVESHAVDYYVPLVRDAHGAAAEGWLKRNGFELGYGWMKFVRDATPPGLSDMSEPEVIELGDGEGDQFARIAAEGFDLPPWAAVLFRDLTGRDGWHCYVAMVDGAPGAAAAMLIVNGVAEFGLAATLESARGRGCQTALLRRRILDAASAGCRLLFVETGERTPERPSASYRNILRAGFREAYLRPNWRRTQA